jgi:hypothetical protein
MFPKQRVTGRRMIKSLLLCFVPSVSCVAGNTGLFEFSFVGILMAVGTGGKIDPGILHGFAVRHFLRMAF